MAVLERKIVPIDVISLLYETTFYLGSEKAGTDGRTGGNP
jgi:hypothetical protein